MAKTPRILQSISAQTSSYALAFTDNTVHFNLSSAATATLPTASGIAGKTYTIGVTSSGFILTINTTSSQLIGTHASGALKMASPGDCITVQSDGTNWKILDFNIDVAFHYVGGTSVSFASAGTLATFQTKQVDTLNCYNPVTGVFTAPFSGTYFFSMQVFSVNTAPGLGNISIIGGTLNSRGQPVVPTTNQCNWMSNGTTYLAAGGTVVVNNSAMSGSSYASNIDNWFTGYRIGD